MWPHRDRARPPSSAPRARTRHRRARRPLPRGGGRRRYPGRHERDSRETTPWVTGVDEALGGSGDPSPVTACGRRARNARAAQLALDGEPSLAGQRVVIQGAGHVGAHLARMLVADGAEVAVSDTVRHSTGRRPRHASRQLPVAARSRDPDGRATSSRPAWLGGCTTTRPRFRNCGAEPSWARPTISSKEWAPRGAIAERDILFAPDFVVNAGGILNIAENSCATTTTGHAHAKRSKPPPLPGRECAGDAASRLSRGRATRGGLDRAEVSARRWEPGDPARGPPQPRAACSRPGHTDERERVASAWPRRTRHPSSSQTHHSHPLIPSFPRSRCDGADACTRGLRMLPVWPSE